MIKFLRHFQFVEAEKHCIEALSFDYQNCESWIIWSHIRYLVGDFRGAKERYERVLQFPDQPTGTQAHSIYIRLASIYLKEENVRRRRKQHFFRKNNQLPLINSTSTRTPRSSSFFRASSARRACRGLASAFAAIE